MKHILSTALCLLMATLLLAALPTDAQADIYEDTLRLHVLAASDSEQDQSTKLLIRDRILAVYGEKLRKAHSMVEAQALTSELLPDIEHFVNEQLRALGASYSARVTLTHEWYDTRVYDTFTLPRGEYLSLRVILGEGEGQNWWCVMYPPMCLSLATADDEGGYTPDEYRLIDGDGRTVKFKLLELLSDVFR